MRQNHTPLKVTRNTKLQSAKHSPGPDLRDSNFHVSKKKKNNNYSPDKGMAGSP